jgi:cobaltochelatase CobT
LASAEPTSDLLKRVTAAACKAIARHKDTAIQFGHAGASLGGDTVHLPAPPPQVNRAAITKLRGISDALALRLRYHDEAVHKRHAPQGKEASAIFETIEQVRCESLGAQRFSGVSDNLDALLDEKCRAKGYAGVTERKEADLADVLGLMVRQHLTGKAPPQAAETMVETWRQWLDKRLGREMSKLVKIADNQEAFATQVEGVIEALDLVDDMDAPADSDDDTRDDDAEDASEEQDDSGESEMEADGSMAGERGEGELIDDGEGGDSDAEDFMAGEGDEEPAGPSQWDKPWMINDLSPGSAYRAYTSAFDEVIEAESLCEPDELERLRHQLDQQLSHLQGVVPRLANRLQRRLMALQTRSWDFDLEEGLLDSGRLARVIANPVHPLSFKLERDTEFRDTMVTLLIPCAGGQSRSRR